MIADVSVVDKKQKEELLKENYQKNAKVLKQISKDYEGCLSDIDW